MPKSDVHKAENGAFDNLALDEKSAASNGNGIALKELHESQAALQEADHAVALHPTSYTETLIHLLRGNVGSGLFAMGDAFKNAGLVLAPCVTVILGIICVHSQHILLTASQEMGRRVQATRLPHFAETVELTFLTGPQGTKKYASAAKFIVNIFLCITQLGFCCVYFVFIATNFQQVLNIYDVKLDIHVHMLIVFLPILLSCWIRSLKYLVPISMFANVLFIFGIIVSFYKMAEDLPAVEERDYVVSDWGLFPLYFGTAIYSFEGIGLVLPLQEQMKKPQQFTSKLGVLNVGMVLVTALFVSMGFLGYLKYGENVMGSITLNLPENDLLSQGVKLAIAVGILFSYALQMYVPVRIIWPGIVAKWGPFKHPVIFEICLRSALVLLTFILAESIPQLGLFISLVGAVSSTALALLIPALIDVVIYWEKGLGNFNWILWKDAFIFIIGIIGFISGTYVSIFEIITKFSEGSHNSTSTMTNLTNI